MSDSNARKGIYNVLFGVVSQVVTIALGIVIPRLFLVSFGSEMNGLLNSVSQLYIYMGLMEAGVGAAALQALYKPVGQQDRNCINGILSATNYYYRRIGCWYLVGVFTLSFLYPLLIKSEIPYWTVVAIIFLNGISGALAFFFQGKYRLLLQADGRKYVITNINLIIHIATSVAKIILIMLGCDIIVIQAAYMVLNLLQMVCISVYVRKNYGWIDLSVSPNQESIAQRNSAFIHQLSDLIFRNTDVLILTFVPSCGLLAVSVYTMYNMLLSMISTAINTLSSGIEFIMGQAFNIDKKRYIKYHDIYEVYSMAIIFSLFTIAYLFLQPFLRLYTSGIDDVQYLDKWLPLLFVITFLLSAGRRASANVINYAQHFKKTQNRAVFESAINISVSLICVFHFKIYGVLFGTIAALLYRTNDMILYANHIILNRSAWPTYRRWLTNLLLFSVFCVSSKLLYQEVLLNSYIAIILWAILSCIVIIPIYIVIDSALDRDVFRNVVRVIRSSKAIQGSDSGVDRNE